MGQLHDLSALEQAAAIRAREVSPVELVDHYLDRVERHSDTVGAFVTVTADAAREQAKYYERLVLDAPPEDLPPLAGVPTAIKDLTQTAGVRTMFGCALLVGNVPTVDDHVVTKLRSAGTISLGKTNTPEFGFPCYTEPAIAPPARTPWDLGRLANGSSGGAAAAVASGLVPFAQGSDGGGSIRSPASACGLIGLKTSRGRIGFGPTGANIGGLSVQGPLTRTVADAAAFLDATSGPSVGDPWWAPPLPQGETFLGHAGREPGRLRIGRYVDPVIPGAVVDPEVAVAWEYAATLLGSLGHDVEDAGPPFTAEVLPHFDRVWALSAANLGVPADRVDQLMPLTRWLHEQGQRLSAAEAMDALVGIQQQARNAVRQHADYDVVLTPVCTLLPRPLGWFTAAGTGEADFLRQKRYSSYTAAYNLTGQPAISLPMGWSDDGLPIGIQLVGRPADEATLLSLAAQLESAADWARRRPPIWFE